MRLADVHKVYFLGIGGIGMSAIARLFLRQGKEVYGYDKTQTTLTNELEQEGMTIHYQDDTGKIPVDIDLVVFTPAIPSDLEEFRHLKSSGLPILKRSQVLGLLSQDIFTVAIAGTHGKTSITSMLSHILKQNEQSFFGFAGGILRNYNSNLIMHGSGDLIVVEADEYDRSFHALKPNIALISSIDPDHLDIYGTYEQLVSDYRVFADGITQGGTLILHQSLTWDVPTEYSITRYGDGSKNRIVRYETDRKGAEVQLELDSELSKPFHFAIPGRHNIENALAAACIAKKLDLGLNDIVSALESFTGVVRRFDVRFSSDKLVYVDDYAHHPKELEAAIKAAREYYPGLKLVGVFQPHLYTRTRDLAEGFAQSLDLLDEAYLLEIYPAREQAIVGVSSQMISQRMKNNCPVVSRGELIEIAEGLENAVLITLGAGDIDLLVAPLEKIFKSRSVKHGGETR